VELKSFLASIASNGDYALFHPVNERIQCSTSLLHTYIELCNDVITSANKLLYLIALSVYFIVAYSP